MAAGSSPSQPSTDAQGVADSFCAEWCDPIDADYVKRRAMRHGSHADKEKDLDAADTRSCEKHPAAVVGIKGGRTTAASGQARIMSSDEFVKLQEQVRVNRARHTEALSFSREAAGQFENWMACLVDGTVIWILPAPSYPSQAGPRPTTISFPPHWPTPLWSATPSPAGTKALKTSPQHSPTQSADATNNFSTASAAVVPCAPKKAFTICPG
ncbi:hypothetical protein LTR17_008588 [Elasticomyces elasticus]|nr:hypothetical protein LTR17_008588 [Elasticomyces elasticus]